MSAPLSQSLLGQSSDAAVLASPSTLRPNGVSETLPELVRLMESATKSIKIQVYEYNTSVYGSQTRFTALDDAIRAAAARGVQVQLLFDMNAMKAGKADIQALSKLKNIQVKLVTLPQWSGGPLQYARLVHSKYLIVDDAQIWVGSENWSSGYFSRCRNLGLTLHDASVVDSLVQVQAKVWNSAYTSSP